MLHITSFNCQGLSSSLSDVKTLCDSSDIIALQETWLFNDDLHVLKNIHEEFTGAGCSSMDISKSMLIGRPFGGIAFLWKKSLTGCCELVSFNDNRIIGLKLTSKNESILLLNVYLPYCCHDNFEQFQMYLGKCGALLQEADTCKICVIGDFNADITSVFGKELVNFCKDEQLIIADVELLGHQSDTYTHVSHAYGTTSWLDHVVCTKQMFDMIWYRSGKI